MPGLLLLLCLKDNLGLKNSPLYRDILNKRYLVAVTALSYRRFFFVFRDYYPKFSNNPLYKAFFIYIIDIFIFYLVLSLNTLIELEPAAKNLGFLGYYSFFIKRRNISRSDIRVAA